MPLTQASNNFIVGLHKQTNEATPGTVADYSFPLLTSDRPMPVQDTAVIQVTDAASIRGDLFKQAGEHWEATVVTPAFDAMLGTMLQSMWPTDTPSGAAPSRSHVFTGLGSVPPFISMYSNFSSGSISETYAAGICSGIEFEFSTERPLKVTYHAVGETPSVAAFTVTTAQTLADGFFTPLAAANGNLKFEEDSLTAVTQTNIVGGKVSVMRDVTPVMTADGATVKYLAQGLVAVDVHLDLVWANWDAYRASFYGAVAGTAASPTLPSGSLSLAFGHSSSATSILTINVDKLAWLTDPPVPNPDASPLMVSADLAVLKPAAGDHAKITLVNNVTPAY
jgi:hypothetical protein